MVIKYDFVIMGEIARGYWAQVKAHKWSVLAAWLFGSASVWQGVAWLARAVWEEVVVNVVLGGLGDAWGHAISLATWVSGARPVAAVASNPYLLFLVPVSYMAYLLWRATRDLSGVRGVRHGGAWLSGEPLQIEFRAQGTQVQITGVGHRRDETGERIYMAVHANLAFRLVNNGQSRRVMRDVDITLWRKAGLRLVQVPWDTTIIRGDWFTLHHRTQDSNIAPSTGKAVDDTFSGIAVEGNDQSPIILWSTTRTLPLELNEGLDDSYFIRVEMDAIGQGVVYRYLYPSWRKPNKGFDSITADKTSPFPRLT